jgi:hypothetical protein
MLFESNDRFIRNYLYTPLRNEDVAVQLTQRTSDTGTHHFMWLRRWLWGDTCMVRVPHTCMQGYINIVGPWWSKGANGGCATNIVHTYICMHHL